MITKPSDKISRIAILGAFVGFALLPLFIGEGWLNVVIEMLILGLAATALNIMFGYAGMVSFGAAAYYAVGAYTTALLLTNTGIPFFLAFLAAPIVAAIIAAFAGWFCVKLTHAYFSLLTLAFGQIIYVILFGWYSFTKGDDGIVNIPVPSLLSDVVAYYYFALIVMALCFILIWLIVTSPFGKALTAIRENPDRAGFIGIDVRRYRLVAFVVSGVFLGVAGALFACFNKSVFPIYSHWATSGELLVVCLLGGVYNFFGPLLGGIVFVLLNKLITQYTEFWPLVLGTVLIGLVLFFKGGIAAFIENRFSSKCETDR
ncbi:MAG: branched-chain amino acid ABC transporter permease [Desulfomonile tiedjei]|nr:branched-chain amino acid ABC transporter permease [Desulfomonile tiedjei]